MRVYLFALLTLILTSCEYEAQLSYKVANNTTSIIKVISEYTDSKTVTDTFLIAPNDVITIAVIGKGLNGVRYYKEKGETLSDFSKVDIYKNDTVKAATNFLMTSRWNYDETTNHSANYKLTVVPTDF